MRKIKITIQLAGLLSLFTLSCTSNKNIGHAQSFEPIEPLMAINEERVIDNLSKAITFKTTLNQEAVPNTAEFHLFHEFLKEQFPLVHTNLELEIINELSLLFKWKGTSSKKAVLFLAHQDVVPVDDPENWQHSPFRGHVDDTYVWGRGALDTKFALMGQLESIEYLLTQGYQPKRTLLFAFGHDEEIMGTRGGEKIAQYLHKNKMEVAFILDEGNPITEGVLKEIDHPLALIGTAAKGQFYLKMEAYGPGGHGSIPPFENPIVKLAEAIQKIQDYKFPIELTTPVLGTFKYLAPEMSGINKLAFNYPLLFAPLIKNSFKKSPTTTALIQSVYSANIIRSGSKDATVPNHAELTLSFGILPGESVDGTVDTIKELVGEDIKLSFIKFPDNGRDHKYEPTQVSPTNYWGFEAIEASVKRIVPTAITGPTLYVGGSDGKHYINQGLTDKVYYFWPIILNDQLLETIHGTDERIPKTQYVNAIKFYTDFIQEINKI